jgi:hypothetical protein
MSLKTLVSLNGTAVENLIDARMAARNAMWCAMTAMQETRPESRDYQHDRTGIMLTIATNDYNARFAALDKIYNELEEEIEHLDAQRTARAANK